MSATKTIRIAVFISGTGRTLLNLIERIADDKLSAEIVLVIASTPRASGLQYAEKNGIPIRIVEKKDFSDDNAFSEANFGPCREFRVDYVALGGYVKFLRIPRDFHNRVLNIHPSLVPAFCGKGYYGSLVHEAVLQYGAKISGCTVHFVDDEYDKGPVILQKAVEVRENDTPSTLNDRVFEAECLAYPEALQLLAENRIVVEDRKIRIRSKPQD